MSIIYFSVLGNITGATVNIDSYKFHENRDGSVDKKKYSFNGIICK